MEKETNNKNNSKNNSKKPYYSIFKPVDQVEGEKQKWPRVGVAFENRDGSLNLIINEAVEAGSRLQLRKALSGGGA